MSNEEKKLLSYKHEEKDDYEKYEEYLDNALAKEEENYVIAITGSYGAGKTSLIETHLRRKAERKKKKNHK